MTEIAGETLIRLSSENELEGTSTITIAETETVSVCNNTFSFIVVVFYLTIAYVDWTDTHVAFKKTKSCKGSSVGCGYSR